MNVPPMAMPATGARPSSAYDPTHYVLLPQHLLTDLRDSPLAIGAYALIARLLRVTGEPVPLSPVDIQRYDPQVSYGAATRALQRLDDAGYVVPHRVRGRKTTYVPTWGRVAGRVLPWDLVAPLLGRPRHRQAIRLDQRLLDLCMGRLQPHHAHPALVTRYLTSPLLGLHEVGAYGLLLHGLPGVTPRLAQLGLVVQGAPQPLPDDATILAIASQQALLDAGSPVALTPAGWALVGLSAPPSPQATGEALFFVPAKMIGESISSVIAHPISDRQDTRQPDIAPASAPSPIRHRDAGSHGSKGSERSESTTPGGGGNPSHPAAATTNRRAVRGRAVRPTLETAPIPVTSASPPVESTEASRLLCAAGVRADVAAQLADRDPEQVRRVLAQAQARAGVRDRAAWTVSALRALPATEAAPSPKVSEKAILFHPRLSGFERQRWLTRFRTADPADRPAVLARFHAEHPLEERDAAAA